MFIVDHREGINKRVFIGAQRSNSKKGLALKQLEFGHLEHL